MKKVSFKVSFIPNEGADLKELAWIISRSLSDGNIPKPTYMPTARGLKVTRLRRAYGK